VLGVLCLAAPPQPEIAPVAPPSHAVVLAALGVAVVLLLGIWELTVHVIVIAHEGAHAAVAMLLGGVPMSITFDENGNGLTRYRGGAVLPRMAGYYGPSLFGLLGAALLVHGTATAVLWIFMLLLAVLLIIIRSVFSFLIVAGLGALLYVTVAYGSGAAQMVVACSLVWILLVGGVIQAFEHFRGGGDYVLLKQEIGIIPRFFWAVLSVLVACVCLVVSAAWLLGFVKP
jgi:hypothetical protein